MIMRAKHFRWLGPCALLAILPACNGWKANGSGKGEKAVECAIGAGALWTRSCPVERSGDLLILRHANGGFRRFRLVSDGRGLTSADGAEEASVMITGKNEIELAIGDDRYRLPATMKEAGR